MGGSLRACAHIYLSVYCFERLCGLTRDVYLMRMASYAIIGRPLSSTGAPTNISWSLLCVQFSSEVSVHFALQNWLFMSPIQVRGMHQPTEDGQPIHAMHKLACPPPAF